MPRHVHLSTNPNPSRLVAESLLFLNGGGLVELAGEIYVIPPHTMNLIAPGVPHAWTACPPGLDIQRLLGLQEELVSDGQFIALYEHDDVTMFSPACQVTPFKDVENYGRCDDL